MVVDGDYYYHYILLLLVVVIYIYIVFFTVIYLALYCIYIFVIYPFFSSWHDWIDSKVLLELFVDLEGSVDPRTLSLLICKRMLANVGNVLRDCMKAMLNEAQHANTIAQCCHLPQSILLHQ